MNPIFLGCRLILQFDRCKKSMPGVPGNEDGSWVPVGLWAGEREGKAAPNQSGGNHIHSSAWHSVPRVRQDPAPTPNPIVTRLFVANCSSTRANQMFSLGFVSVEHQCFQIWLFDKTLSVELHETAVRL